MIYLYISILTYACVYICRINVYMCILILKPKAKSRFMPYGLSENRKVFFFTTYRGDFKTHKRPQPYVYCICIHTYVYVFYVKVKVLCYIADYTQFYKCESRKFVEKLDANIFLYFIFFMCVCLCISVCK